MQSLIVLHQNSAFLSLLVN